MLKTKVGLANAKPGSKPGSSFPQSTGTFQLSAPCQVLGLVPVPPIELIRASTLGSLSVLSLTHGSNERPHNSAQLTNVVPSWTLGTQSRHISNDSSVSHARREGGVGGGL